MRAPEGFVTISVAARILKVPRDTLYMLRNTGQIEGILCHGRYWLVPLPWIDEHKGKLAPIPRGYVTISEAARRLGLSRDKVDWLRKTGKIRGVKHISDYFWVVPTHWVRNYRKKLQAVPDGYITLNEAAKRLNISRTRLCVLRDQKRIDGIICVQKRWYVPLEWVERKAVNRDE